MTAQPSLFANLIVPQGVATDINGNVFVTSEDFGPTLTILNPSGQLVNRIQLGGVISPVDAVGGRLALNENSGFLYSLSANGTIQEINPSTGEVVPIINLQQLSTSTNSVYDVAQGGFFDFDALIQTSLSSFGDIAIHQNGDITEFYISGLSAAQAFPFVMRLQFTEQGLISSEVIASSTASATVNQISAPGIAVNSQGTVVTTLPIPNSNATGNFNTLVAFSDDIAPQQLNVGAFNPIATGVDVSSNGLTTDAQGNFYVATSTVGSTLGGVAGGGTVLVFNPALEFIEALSTSDGQTSFATNDVAVSPDGSRLYATFSSTFFNPFGGLNGGLFAYSTADIGNNIAASGSSFTTLNEDEFNETDINSVSVDPLTGNPSEISISVSEPNESLFIPVESSTDLENTNNSDTILTLNSDFGISSSTETLTNPSELEFEPLLYSENSFDNPDSFI